MKGIPKVLNVIMSVVVLILLVIIFNQNRNQTTQDVKVESLVNQNEGLLVQIENLQKENKEVNNQAQELSYIRPEFLQGEWDKIILETYDEEVVIDSKAVIEAFRNQFGGTRQTDSPYPSGYPIEFTFHIYSGDQKYTFISLENDFFMNAEMDTFYRSEKDYTQLAKAFLSKPIDYLDENLFSKLYHSGMIVGEKEFPFPVLDSFRIKGIASSFASIKKEEMNSQPIVEDYIEKFIFYYYGDKYYMTLYDEYINVSDEQSTIDLWYKTPQDGNFSILAVLSAG
ncbi:hypothetical protein MHZ92_11100 [Sporosarcina sp. ACRSL]|uniref:hypothetical protein n=1 Tax=Sporosarcina sp. ACRSL TaxID=2918215 RepID=UPI001EF691DC|nr:hypothetical protein [Sporosarcina sp. ACRSL]MCG7344686.1 hypothetical protein [Sporosarcina sp. ACRSL]